jgi:DNA-binding NtrC family response regulator
MPGGPAEGAVDENRRKILVIDDDPKVRWILSEQLSDRYEILEANDGYEGIQMASQRHPDLILLDVRMPGLSGLDVLERLRSAKESLPVIMLSGHGESDTVAAAIQLGAMEFISKPFDSQEVAIHLEKAFERVAIIDENARLKLRLQNRFENLVGDSPVIQRVKETLDEIADSDLTVLIRGESGTGKEVVALMIHTASARSDREFTKVNCAAIPRDLLEAELFGYERGAFTGAHKTKPGRFETADKSTMFLDEIGDMPLELQPKLLQVLEQQEFVRVGGLTTIKVDVRIVCATNRDLEDAIAERAMREDLYYRLNEVTVTLPPLRERVEDIPLLMQFFLDKYNGVYNRSLPGLSATTMRKLMEYAWPGNVRQLENLIKQVVVRSDESIIEELLTSAARGPRTQASAARNFNPTGPQEDFGYSLKKRVSAAVEREERGLIAEVLRKVNWNRRKAAEILEISYRSLLYKIKDYDLSHTEL